MIVMSVNGSSISDSYSRSYSSSNSNSNSNNSTSSSGDAEFADTGHLILVITVLAAGFLALITLISLGYYLYCRRQQVKAASVEEDGNTPRPLADHYRSTDAPLLLGSQILAGAGRNNEYFKSWWGSSSADDSVKGYKN